MTTSKTARKTAAPAKVAKPAADKRARTTATPIAAAAVVEVSGRDKPKLVRDSFTIPKFEYAILEQLKSRAMGLERPTKKSEMLRAGIAALQAMTDKAFLATLNSIPSLKTGRPIGSEVPARATKKTSKAAASR